MNQKEVYSGIAHRKKSENNEKAFERNVFELQLLKEVEIEHKLDNEQLLESYNALKEAFQHSQQVLEAVQGMNDSFKTQFENSERFLFIERSKNKRNLEILSNVQSINKQYQEMNDILVQRYENQLIKVQELDGENRELDIAVNVYVCMFL